MIKEVDKAVESAVEYEQQKDKGSADRASRHIKCALDRIGAHEELHPKGHTKYVGQNRMYLSYLASLIA